MRANDIPNRAQQDEWTYGGKNMKVESFVKNDTHFDELLKNSILQTFASSVGGRSAGALMHTFELLQPGIRAGIPQSFSALDAAVEESFGSFSISIKNIIVERVCMDLAFEFEESVDDFDFVRALMELRKKYYSETKQNLPDQ